MSPLITVPEKPTALPDHTQLPDKDDEHMMNFEEAPQSRLLTDALEPTLRQLHPNGHYLIGRDCGLYWRFTDPPLRGCKAPDWFYVPGVSPLPSGEWRRSYVLWHEIILPQVVLEYASGDGSVERDQTPTEGKFWVYEQGIGIPFYGIFVWETGQLEMYHLVAERYQLMVSNDRNRFPVPPLGVELGVWHGTYETAEGNWLRWWDVNGNLLPTGGELAEQAGARAEQAGARAERLAAKLRELGVDPDTV